MSDDSKPANQEPVFRPEQIEEGGVTIPVSTPTAINVPNPWRPAPIGDAPSARHNSSK